MKIKVQQNPKSTELLDLINEALSKRAFLVIIACCKIEYRG
jgi:RecB family endonuclease NucS